MSHTVVSRTNTLFIKFDSNTRAFSSKTSMSVPPELVARVFHDVAFQKPETRITASTVALSTEYTRLFISEAVERANDVRAKEVPPTAIDGINNVEAENEQPLQGYDQFGDTSMEEDEPEIQEEDKLPPASGTTTLDTRHLSAVAGVLVLDF